MMRQSMEHMERMRDMMGRESERFRSDEYARMLVLQKMLDVLSPEAARSSDRVPMMRHQPERTEQPAQPGMGPGEPMASRMDTLEETLHQLLEINQRMLEVLESQPVE